MHGCLSLLFDQSQTGFQPFKPVETLLYLPTQFGLFEAQHSTQFSRWQVILEQMHDLFQ